MKLRRVITASAIALACVSQAFAEDTATLSATRLNEQTGTYDSRMDERRITAKPYDPTSRAVLIDGIVTIVQRSNGDESGLFVQCQASDQGEQCSEWIYAPISDTIRYQFMLPMVRR